jgi:predicted GNAT superfamily acetyltransferase
VVIRPATGEDWPAILELNSEWEHFTSPLDTDSLADLHAQAAYHRVAIRDGKVVGFLLALREGADYSSPNYVWFDRRGGNFLYIDRVIVSGEAQGRGIAADLYDDVFEFARASGIERLVCEVNHEPPNEPSRRFHEKLGFSQLATQWVSEGTKEVSLLEILID